MLLSEPLANLKTFFRTSLIKFYHNGQRMLDSFYHITESSELNWKIRVQNILIWPCRSAMFENFCVGIHMLWPITLWNLISYVCETRKLVMAILHWKEGLLSDKTKSMVGKADFVIERVYINVWKGENPAFLPFPFSRCIFFSCFSIGPFKFGAVCLTLSQTSPGFYVSAVKVFWKHCGKRRNCSWRAISPFPTVFSTRLETFLPFSSKVKL